jgi:hypothetical protein
MQQLVNHICWDPLTLKCPRLDIKSLYIRACADASLGTNFDGSSQLGYVIVPMDETNRFNLVTFRSGQCHRVTHSAMAAETCAFAECFDAAYVLNHDLETLLCRPIRLQMLTDSKQLFDCMSHSSRAKERRIMIDVAAAKQAFERNEISDLGHVRGSDTLADCFTKVTRPVQLMEALERRVLDHGIQQWIVRDL